MTSPDAPPDKVGDAAQLVADKLSGVADEVVALAGAAYAQGARAGFEASAQCIDLLATNADHPVAAELLTRLRDEIRLLAFQIPDPDASGGDGA